MRIDILTLFPAIASIPLGESMIGKAQERGLVTIQTHNLRDWAKDKHRTTDDAPYGGSQGMVMKCEPIFDAIEELKGRENSPESPAPRVVLLTPGGQRFDQKLAAHYARPGSHLILLCGHYEGIDQRVIDHLVDDEISIGDYVLTNGALAAAVFTDAVVRLLPGVLGDENSAPDDSFASGLIEGPQYTRPVEFRGWRVPDILLSGHHAAIARWRREQALEKTRKVRPDLLGNSFRMASMTPESAYQLALAHRQAGRLADSEALLRQIVAARADYPEAWHQLGLVVLTLGRAGEAVECISRAISFRPGLAHYHSDLGVAYLHHGQFGESIASFQRALHFAPNASQTHRNLGDALFAFGRQDDAIASYQRALALAPHEASTHNNLGNVFLRQGQLAEAGACYERAVQLEPGLLVAHSNLGDVLTKLGRPDAGLVCAQRVLALDRNFPDGHLNMGVAYWQLGRFAEAEACYRRALDLRPDLVSAHLNLGVLLLLLGRYEEGWREYEWHWRAATHASRRRDFAAPPWDGRPVPGQTILTYADQGAGDTVHFLRYLPLLLEHSGAARVIVECQPALVTLVQQLSNERIVFASREAFGNEPPRHDLHVPLFNLPLVLRRFEPLPMVAPYLRAEEGLRAVWRPRLDRRAVLRVGLAWAGNPVHADDRRRSMPPENLLPLLHTPGVSFLSLQVEPRGPLPPALTAAGVFDAGAEIADFADTAALLSELDLVITVDTSTAHVAGALGRPVWLMLPFIPDWRWGFEREDTPWYPTMRLFRQAKAGDWAGVVERVALALRGMVVEKN